MNTNHPFATPHVCFVNSLRGLGGAELWFLAACRNLLARGVQASLVAQPGSRLLAGARAEGLPAAAIPIRCDGAFWTLYKLQRHFRRTKVTALVCNLTKDLKAAGLAGRWAGVSVRLASRESDFPLKGNAYYRWYFRHAATGLLVNSEATRRTVLASAPWLDPARVHLLYKGIDTGRFRPSDPPPSRRPPVVGFVGQLIARKGLDTLMAAWQQLDEAAWPATPPRLRLAGEGSLQADIERWRSRLRRPACVELCGFLTDVPAFWAECRCAVLPSRSEGFGLAAAEASACGVPVIATAASSLPEIVHAGRTGLLVPVDRPRNLAAALARLLGDGPLADRFGAEGRRLIVGAFDERLCWQRLWELTCPEVTR
ncbi:MAG: glycosyltransferase [Candidatus Krumholzibacteria bacterium]|nr:glycosyltransferase [Candidatus Krumholzibacteria bacterium]